MGATTLAEKQLRLGIIGPGNLTDHMIQKLTDISHKIKSIAFYNHGSDRFLNSYNGHVLQMGHQLKPTPEHQRHLNFTTFMDNSEVVIYNVGGFTSERLLDRKSMQTTGYFSELEGMLESEASKIGSKQAPFITSYHVLKELEQLQKSGEYSESAVRLKLLFPMIVSKTRYYAEMMRDYFTTKKVHPSEKLLIVTANSSENNLDVILSYIPEWQEAAVSLAIEKKRLMGLLNQKFSEKLGALSLENITLVGDHDAHIIPSYRKLEALPQSEEEQRRVAEFQAWLKKPEVLQAIHADFDSVLRSYAFDNDKKMDIAVHAGEGVVDILKSIFEKDLVASSGYFQELGERYGLEKGQGLSFVGDHKIKWDGKNFQIIPQPQKLDSIAEELFEKCKREHINLHQGLVANPHIPVPGFPGTKAGSFQGSSAVEIIDTYNREPRLHTELVVPLFSVKDKSKLETYRSKIVLVDLSSLDEKIIEFDDFRLGAMQQVKLDNKDYLACGFMDKVVLVDPENQKIVAKFQLPPASQPNLVKHRINSITSYDNILFTSHSLDGVYSIDTRSGESIRVVPGGNYNSHKKIAVNQTKSVVVNQELVYYLQGNTLQVMDVTGKDNRTYANDHHATLEAMTFDGNDIYVVTNKFGKHGQARLLRGRIGQPEKGLEIIHEEVKACFLRMAGRRLDDRFCLAVPSYNNLYCISIGNGPVELRPIQTETSIMAVEQHVHTYALLKHEQGKGNKVYEFDAHTDEKQVIFNAGGQGVVLQRLAILNTTKRGRYDHK